MVNNAAFEFYRPEGQLQQVVGAGSDVIEGEAVAGLGEFFDDGFELCGVGDRLGFGELEYNGVGGMLLTVRMASRTGRIFGSSRIYIGRLKATFRLM